MRIHLDLPRHCLEIELRRRHERTVAEALRPSAGPDRSETPVEPQLAPFRSALVGWDFRRLRAKHAALNAKSRAAVFLEVSEDRRRVHLLVDGKTAAEAPLLETP